MAAGPSPLLEASGICKAYPGVQVESYSGLMRDFVLARGASAMVRGLRAVTDFDYEYQLAGMNRSLMPDVETIFLTPGDKYQYISSTYVREIATLSVSAVIAQQTSETTRVKNPSGI